MLPEEIEQIKSENERLKKENETLKQVGTKEKLYDKVPVSLTTMNYIVMVLVALLVIVMVIALMDR